MDPPLDESFTTTYPYISCCLLHLLCFVIHSFNIALQEFLYSHYPHIIIIVTTSIIVALELIRLMQPGDDYAILFICTLFLYFIPLEVASSHASHLRVG